MTNKEASDELFDLMISGEITKKNLALKMAIKALEQQSCEDCISRQTAIEAMGEQPLNWTDTPEEIAEEQMWQDHIKALKELPSVTPARAKGEWISETFTTSIDSVPKCPFCNKRASKFSNFCPNCGAKMVEPQEIHCNCTDEEIAKSFIEDVEAVKDLLPIAESEDKDADSN